jgi:hypothetical protein
MISPSLVIAQDHAAGAGLVCFAAIILLFYFLPAFVAGTRGHQNTAAIFVLNLFLGWTFVGWVVALVWAFTVVDRRDDS